MDEAKRVADDGFTLLILICVVCVLAIWFIARQGVTL
jgi:Tfp pilus assembly protein PilE